MYPISVGTERFNGIPMKIFGLLLMQPRQGSCAFSFKLLLLECNSDVCKLYLKLLCAVVFRSCQII